TEVIVGVPVRLLVASVKSLVATLLTGSLNVTNQCKVPAFVGLGSVVAIEDTVGTDVSIVTDWLPLLPVFPAKSDCVAASVYEPCADSALVSVALQAPDEHVAVPFSLAVPLTDQPTLVLSPDAVPHAPPIVVTF